MIEAVATSITSSAFDNRGNFDSSGIFDNQVNDSTIMGEFENTTDYIVTSAINFSVATTSEVDVSAMRLLGIVIGIIDIFAGTSGNLLTLLAIYNNKRLQTTFHIFIANLCVIDLLTASTMMPFNVTSYIKQEWPFENDFTCSFMAFSYYCCGYTSIVCLITITVNRYVGVCHPKHSNRLYTRNRTVVVIIISWLFAPVVLSPFFLPGEGGQRGFGWVQRLTLCVFKITAKWQHYYMEFTRVLFQLLPLLVIVALYTLIFIEVRKSGRDVMARSKRSATKRITGGINDRCNVCDLNNRILKSPTQPMTSQRNSLSAAPSIHVLIDCKKCSSETDPSRHNTEEPTNIEEPTPKSNEIANLIAKERSGIISEPVTPRTKGKDNLGVKVEIKYLQVGKKKRINKKEKEVAPSPTLHSNENSHCQPTKSNLRLKRQYTAMQLEERKRKSLDRKLLRMSVAICIVFMILFLPSVAINLAQVKDPRVHMFASVITWLNSCVNPVVYCFINKRMRLQYKNLLLKFWGRVCVCIGKESTHSAHRRTRYSRSSQHSESQKSSTRNRI
nr:alpha-2 adrenergic receptor [Ciona intestinalis]|eukprot:XP_002120235.3 alpha-2 adrenergic receptor [Ciona intestinalis]